MKKGILYGLLSVAVVAVAVGLSAYLVYSKPSPEKNDANLNTMYVKTEQLVLSETESTMDYRGRVTSFDNVSLSAEVSGRIMQGDVRFKTGESFRKNDVLINIYSDDVKASLKSGKSSFLQTVSKILPDIKVDYPSEYDKWFDFFNSIEPEGDLPSLPEINSDKERVFLASNNVLTSYYSLQQQEINLKKYTIRAPFDGSFKQVNKEIGAVASPGVELATIIRSDKLEIIVPVFPSDLAWIHIGDKVKVAGNNGLTEFASVSRISGFVDESTQSVNVYLTYYVSDGHRFLDGEYVDVSFSGVKLTGFEIPREAVFGNNLVYVLNADKLEEREVEILRTLNDSYIISGPDESSIVVTESLASVNPTVKYISR